MTKEGAEMTLQQKLSMDQVIAAVAAMDSVERQELKRRLSPLLGKYRSQREQPEEKPGSLWRKIKSRLAQEMPELAKMSPEARRSRFDELSEKIATDWPYDSLEAFEQAMRGDPDGLARY